MEQSPDGIRVLLAAFLVTLRYDGDEHVKMEEEMAIDGNAHFPPCPSHREPDPPCQQYANRNLVLGVVVGAIFITTSVMSLLEPCLPLWLLKTMKPEVRSI